MNVQKFSTLRVIIFSFPIMQILVTSHTMDQFMELNMNVVKHQRYLK